MNFEVNYDAARSNDHYCYANNNHYESADYDDQYHNVNDDHYDDPRLQ